MEEARVAEVYEFAQRASDALLASSEFAGPFREALEEFHSAALSALDASDLPREYLRAAVGLESDDPISELGMAVGRAAETDVELARYLRDAIEDRLLIEPGTS